MHFVIISRSRHYLLALIVGSLIGFIFYVSIAKIFKFAEWVD